MSQPITYREAIDFAVLAQQDADFAKLLKASRQLDFSDPKCVLQLTKSLLKRDFNLIVELPADRLCPSVPNRQIYVLWIQGLLDTSSSTFSDAYNPKREVVGLDIGTGASCIYPLLGCVQRPEWKFIGTDLDEISLQYAQRNVDANHLQGRVKLLKTQLEDPLLPFDKLGLESLDFTMCNPPFYSSRRELESLAEVKQRPPYSACTGSELEMVTEGGEVAFVTRMIEESLVLRGRVQWYTSMLGKHSSVAELLEKLKLAQVDNIAVTEFVHGNKTRRWGIAWSFEAFRPAMHLARGVNSFTKASLPFPSLYEMTVDWNVSQAGQAVDACLSDLPLRWQWRASVATGVGFCSQAVWSRAARRQASRKGSTDEVQSSDDEDDDTAFGFKIHVKTTSLPQRGAEISIRWVKGHDSVIFESFCGMMRRSLKRSQE